MSHPSIQLKVISGPDKGKEKRFQSSCIRLGRDPRKNDFVLTDQYVSALHGRLSWEKSQLHYEDLQSRHGTSITTSVQQHGQSIEKRVELHDMSTPSHYDIGTNAQLLLGSSLIYLTFLPPSGNNDTIEEREAIMTAPHSNESPQPIQPILPIPFDHAKVGHAQGMTAGYNAAEGPTPTGSFISPSHSPEIHSLDNMVGTDPHYSSSRPNLQDEKTRTTPEAEVAMYGEIGPLTSYPRKVDTQDKLDNAGYLSPSDTADDNAYAHGKGAPEFTFEELATVSMQEGVKFRGYSTHPDTSFKPSYQQWEPPYYFKQLDKRLNILFKLSSQLNRLTMLKDMLALVVNSTFEAFPGAKFFALYRTSKAGLRDVNTPVHQTLEKYMTRVRGKLDAESEELILSQSLLEKVAEKREAVLFTRDNNANPTVSIIEGEIWSCMCAPLIGQRSLLGVMLVDTRQQGALFTPQDLDLFSVLASNAAFAIERTQLTEEIVNMFEGFVEASVSAIEARDPTTAGHSDRVATYSLSLAEAVNDIEVGKHLDTYFTKDEMVELRYAALLHDFGKIGVSENVLNKACRINDERMGLIKQRFDALKSDYKLHLTEQWFRELRDNRKAPSDEGWLKIEDDSKSFAEELSEMALWLEKIRKVERLSPDDVAKIKKLANRKVPLGVDRMVPLLQADEITNLGIERGTLNSKEWEEMRSHAALSESYLDFIPWSSELSRVPCIAGAHHEKLDGSGYPQGLTGDVLIPQVRILTIADIFDALTAWDRPYRKAIPHTKAVSILTEEASAGKLDKELVEIFALKVVPKLDEFPTRPESGEKVPTPLSVSSSAPGVRPLPLAGKKTGHYTLFQQEKFHPQESDDGDDKGAGKSRTDLSSSNSSGSSAGISSVLGGNSDEKESTHPSASLASLLSSEDFTPPDAVPGRFAKESMQSLDSIPQAKEEENKTEENPSLSPEANSKDKAES
ncbi:MAG: FHA domain-containing protein [Deltaproteobacteria bacterium]|nr:MAG: FHA domain-containing protein [Deltaproteobacteria bacterium]